MRIEYNVYLDESCHLMHNMGDTIVFGAVWCPKTSRHNIFKRIREIKVEHGLKPDFEIKWNKVSPAKSDFYIDLVNYFFDNDDLHFRALVVPNKNELDHNAFDQTHDLFYYKMCFQLLKVILSPEGGYNIYIDIKDTRSQKRVIELHNTLRNSHYDFHDQIIKKVQQIQSHEVEILQLTDLLTGAIGYINRGLKENAGKVRIIERIKERSGYTLLKSTLPKEEKMNLFIWKSQNLLKRES